MPIVIMRAEEFGLNGHESCEDLESNAALRAKVESIRHMAGHLMALGDVSEKSVPKMTLVSSPRHGGTINTRSFIPHRCHSGIGVFAAVSVATACALRGTHAFELADHPADGRYRIEHPTGVSEILVEKDGDGQVVGTGTLRTARKLMDGLVFPGPERAL
jgi:4-oxalomesaconate tautomerase